jgi:flavin-binding protein dodecin
MSEHVYKIIELTGSSKKNIEEAIRNALNKASESVHNMRWFQLTETRGYIEDGDISYFQVGLKVGFTVD